MSILRSLAWATRTLTRLNRASEAVERAGFTRSRAARTCSVRPAPRCALTSLNRASTPATSDPRSTPIWTTSPRASTPCFSPPPLWPPDRPVEAPRGGRPLPAVHEGLHGGRVVPEVGQGRPKTRGALREVPLHGRLRGGLGLPRELEGLQELLGLRAEDRLLEGLGRLVEVHPVPLPEGEDELRLLDDLHRALALRLPELLERGPDRGLEARGVPRLVRLPRTLRGPPGRRRVDAEGLRVREGPVEIPEPVLRRPVAADDRIDPLVGLAGRVEGLPERVPPEGLPGLVQVSDGPRQVHAQVHGGHELLP